MLSGSRETDSLVSKDMGEESKQQRLSLASFSHCYCHPAMTFPKLKGKGGMEEKLSCSNSPRYGLD